MAKNPDTQLGYDFEDELTGLFRKFQSLKPMFYHRFPDSKAARGYIASQPSDFLVSSPNLGTFLLEAKASIEKPTLASCTSMIRPSQIGMMKKAKRGGMGAYVIFYSQMENLVEIWLADDIVAKVDGTMTLKQLKAKGPFMQFDYFSLEEELLNFILP